MRPCRLYRVVSWPGFDTVYGPAHHAVNGLIESHNPIRYLPPLVENHPVKILFSHTLSVGLTWP